MFKSIKTFFLGIFLITPIALLILYTIHTSRQESAKTSVNLSNLKLVSPVAIIDEITKKIEEEDLEDASNKIKMELPDPNIPSSNGTPLIVFAAEKDYADIVADLIQKGADPNKADLNTSETALIKAVRNQDFEIISILLNAGANPNLGTNQGVTPLSLAISLKNENLATHLLSSGATNGISKEKLLLYTFEKNNIGVMLMLAGGISPNITDKDNNTPLIISSANGDIKSAKQLVSYRANLNSKNKYGMTPLLYAVKGKYWDMAEYLINSGANINSTNIYGQNTLFWAAYHGNADLVHNLLMRGANYEQKTRRGQTALQMARALGHKKTVKMIEDFIAYKKLPRDSKGNIILPKVNQQKIAVSEDTSSQADEYEENAIISELRNQAQQKQSATQPQQNKQSSSNNRTLQQSSDTQINDLQNQAEMPEMPGNMDMSSIMSMAEGAQGNQTGDMGAVIKQMQNVSTYKSGSKTQQNTTNTQVPNNMDMSAISKMIPPGTLPEG
ncbi:MAG: ankyrin repeat domain-containing protein, partial [Elusimicrobiaceae bacterium]|nr:ankyrin repeat domain-containing protein [Elusimicrobiaceae bacterium]